MESGDRPTEEGSTPFRDDCIRHWKAISAHKRHFPQGSPWGRYEWFFQLDTRVFCRPIPEFPRCYGGEAD